ncbi:DUF1275 domain-containing protein [Histoplasma capsulatum var. duboisii H88]|uniref:DUF1275 domain-containing protein n=2 Tax=Ajellomyces capsulatus TaxID=5037 RepID=F0UK81_AJEC8|nr:DUF1275 domain-containing protein [Histoplasma capsulatum H143]EGC46716.1 DUF1275 domain-containing protein [Histoplasma capsulatum var. duboisii H88]QSS57345.1 DUF1275 domain-containing protein [Histoplasma capsulatum var. duboisii H88]
MKPNYGNQIKCPASHIMSSKELSVQFSAASPNAQEDRELSRSRKGDNDLPHLSRSSSFTFIDVESCVSKLPWHRRLSHHLKEEVDPAWSDMLLLACSFSSGVIDSLAFRAWGSFANMQTGNIVFLALGISGDSSLRWPKCLIAIAAFLLGILFFINGSRLLNPLRRSTLITSFTIQTLAVLIASILVETDMVKNKPAHGSSGISWMEVIPISLLAFQAGGQIITSRLLKIDEIPTLVLTTVLCDLLIDPRLLANPNTVRNRRIGSFGALFVGAMVSGFLSKEAGVASSLWLATAIKGAVTLCWVVWKGKGLC